MGSIRFMLWLVVMVGGAAINASIPESSAAGHYMCGLIVGGLLLAVQMTKVE